MNQNPNKIVQSTLERLLQEKMELFAKAEEEKRPIAELNAIYQQIKVLRHKVAISQPEFAAFTASNTRYEEGKV